LDLANKLSFDIEYLPFGNSKRKQNIYRSANYYKYVDECLRKRIVICNTAAKILEFVLREFGVNIKTISEDSELQKLPHVYNIIKPKDGKCEYTIDIQEDMYRVQMNGRTPNYGLYPNTERQVISYKEQEEMDRKLGYINDEKYYTDEYLYLLKYDIARMDSLYEKVKHVLEHIEVFDNKSVNYINREWYHVRILEYLFTDDEFNFNKDSRNIRVIDSYRMINNRRIPVNIILLTDEGIQHVFVYKKNKQGYKEISIDDMINYLENGLIIHGTNSKSIEKQLRKNI
jgi:hypothetical protein